jgi:hypothetical protein
VRIRVGHGMNVNTFSRRHFHPFLPGIANRTHIKVDWWVCCIKLQSFSVVFRFVAWSTGANCTEKLGPYNRSLAHHTEEQIAPDVKTVTKLERNNTTRNIERGKWRINGIANMERKHKNNGSEIYSYKHMKRSRKKGNKLTNKQINKE